MPHLFYLREAEKSYIYNLPYMPSIALMSISVIHYGEPLPRLFLFCYETRHMAASYAMHESRRERRDESDESVREYCREIALRPKQE